MLAVHAQINQFNLNKLLQKAKVTNSKAVLISQNGKLITENYFASGHAAKKLKQYRLQKALLVLPWFAC